MILCIEKKGILRILKRKNIDKNKQIKERNTKLFDAISKGINVKGRSTKIAKGGYGKGKT